MNLDLRVSNKKAVSVYGLQSRPFTLYADEWKIVLEADRPIIEFIARQHLQLACRCGEERRLAVHTLASLHQEVRNERGFMPHSGSVTCRRSEKGAVSLHGLRRFPVTLYCSAWMSVLLNKKEIAQFIKDNDQGLDWKGCGVPRPRNDPSGSGAAGVPTVVGPDNIRRPAASQRRE